MLMLLKPLFVQPIKSSMIPVISLLTKSALIIIPTIIYVTHKYLYMATKYESVSNQIYKVN